MNPKQEIRVGLSISLTGGFRRQGQQALDGIRLWQAYINAQGGIAAGAQERRPVHLIYYDDQSRASQAQQNALRLLREDRIEILFGPYSSALTLAVAQVAGDHKKILWNHGGSSDEIVNRGHCCLMNTASPASDYLRAFPRWLAKQAPGLRRICVARSTRGTFASQVARGVVEAAESAGFPPVEFLPMNPPLVDPRAVIQELRAIGPEVLVLAGSFQDEVKLVRARHLWPETVREVAAVAAGVNAFYEEVREGTEGVVGPSQWEPGVRFPEALGPDSDWFVRSFQQRFGRLPEYTAAGGFALGLVLTECIRRAGSLEDKRLRAVAAELDFHTFFGRFRMEPETGRQIGHRILLTRWQHGRKAVIETGEAPTALK